jgi:hypothetical protein
MANDTLLVGAFIPPARGDVPVPTDRGGRKAKLNCRLGRA